MRERDQYEPCLTANSVYWSQPLAAYADAAVWSGDPKVQIFKNTMNSTYYDGYKGPISTATGAVNADYVLVRMCAAVATGASTPEAAAAEAEQRCKRYFRRQGRQHRTERSTLRGAIDTQSFRDGAKHQTRNLEIPGSMLRIAPE